MKRRSFLGWTFATLAGTAWVGCRGRQYARVLDEGQPDLVGSHSAGAETYNQLVDTAVGRMLGREHDFLLASAAGPHIPGRRVCFLGVENRSAEEMGDFKEQVYEQIDASIAGSGAFNTISRRYIEAGLRSCHLRPDDLLTPDGQRAFQAAMEQQGQAFDYLLYATLTSGTTVSNDDKQRDYLLTLELVNVLTGQYTKESATIRKGYHKSQIAMLKGYKPFTQR